MNLLVVVYLASAAVFAAALFTTPPKTISEMNAVETIGVLLFALAWPFVIATVVVLATVDTFYKTGGVKKP